MKHTVGTFGHPVRIVAPKKDFRRGRGELRLREETDVSLETIVGDVLDLGRQIGGNVIKTLASGGPVFTPGADIRIQSQAEAAAGNGVCPPGFHVAVDPCSGAIVCKKTRRRRKRMLTCADKADIAFITGTLGKGQMAQVAISALITKCQ